MANRLVKITFLDSPYIVTVDNRSFTLKKENKPDDQFPTPLGYHRSLFTLADCLFRRGFVQVKGDLAAKEFTENVKQMWEGDIKPFILELSESQNELTEQLISESKKTNQKYKKLAELVRDGDYQGAAKIAKTIETE